MGDWFSTLGKSGAEKDKVLEERQLQRIQAETASKIEAFKQEAQAKAVALRRPGMAAADVHAAAMAYLEAEGVGELFTHGLGHGIGLQTHETPSLSPRSAAVLRPGMVVTVEPGLYRPGKSGLRWEYMVAVTDDGARVL